MSTADFGSLSAHFLPLTAPSLFICNYAQCYPLNSIHCLFLPLRFLISLSICPLLSFAFCPLSDSLTMYLYFFCVTISIAVFHSLSTLRLPQTLRSLVLCVCVHCYRPYTVKGLSNLHCTLSWYCVTMSNAVLYTLSTVCQPHTLPSLGSLSLCKLLSSPFCTLSLYLTRYLFCFCFTSPLLFSTFLPVSIYLSL